MAQECAIIGMSPGNSYFKSDVIRFLLTETKKRFGKTVVFIPDIPAIFTYKALGYSDVRARSKAVLNGNNLKNRVKRVMEELHLTSEDVQVLDWKKEVENDPSYQSSLKHVNNLLNRSSEFRTAVLGTTEAVLLKSGKLTQVSQEAVTLASQYLLAEFSFMEEAPRLFGCERATYIYHRPWPVYERYIAGDFDGMLKNYLGFALLQP